MNLTVSDLLAKCEESDAGCWEWQRATIQGYGAVAVNGKMIRAHRVMFALTYGMDLEQLDGVVIRHRCDNPPCVNPLHLETGTQQQNVMDHLIRSRHRLRRGNPAASLLDYERVTQMRRRANAGESQRSLAREFGVSESAASMAIKGRTWQFVEEPPLVRDGRHK